MITQALFEVSWKAAALSGSEWTPDGELPDPNSVTPGVIGFAFMAFIAIAMMLLAWDMNRRIRRIKFREEARERIAAEQAEAEASGAAGVSESQHDQ